VPTNKETETRGPVYIENEDVYIGNWNIQLDTREGTGKIIFRDGSIFEGAFSNNTISGFGRYIRFDGEIYTGNWENDNINGQGTLVNPNGYRYSGNW